jgi:hypothetical protein
MAGILPVDRVSLPCGPIQKNISSERENETRENPWAAVENSNPIEVAGKGPHREHLKFPSFTMMKAFSSSDLPRQEQ